MIYKKLKHIPQELRTIPSPPPQLYAAGTDLKLLLKMRRVAIVGSRKVTSYGEQVTNELSRKLAEQGVAIVSGLALGVDGLAHAAALQASGKTIAVLPSSLDIITPPRHHHLAQAILEQGGALVSEYDEGTPARKQNFVARNRLIAGLAEAVLITEAASGSGSLYTAEFARKQGKPVLAVPGNITSPASAGTNALLKTGAVAVTDYTDVMRALGLTPHVLAAIQVHSDNPDEQLLLELLLSGLSDASELQRANQLEVPAFNQLLTGLELRGQVRQLSHGRWTIV